MEDWVSIRQLRAKNPQMSLRELAEKLGVDHHTVKRALARDNPPEYKRPARENPLLVCFKEVIFEMLNVKHFRRSRVLEEIRSKGFTGGKTAFYAYARSIVITKQEHYTPYETRPGEQSQFDWAEYTVLLGGLLTKVYFFTYINAFSRYQVLEVSLLDNQGSIFEALENGLIESGGAPERIQTDNDTSFVTNASKNHFQWNARYLHFCGHYGFEPSRSLPYHPWSKGKVEKPNQYLENHFIAGNSFEDFEDLYRKTKAFQQRVNQRQHATIKTTPEELFVKDREALSPLPATRYIGIKEEIRQVTFDCLFSFGGSRYSAPWMFAGKQVWVRVAKGYYLEIFSQANKLVARHNLATVKGSVVINKEHYRSNKTTDASFDRLRIVFREKFPTQELFLEKLQAQKRSNAHRHLYQFLELAGLYQKDDMIEAIKQCMKYNVFNATFISGFLEKNCRQTFMLPPPAEPMRRYHLTSEHLSRDLSEYNLFKAEKSEGG